MFDMATCVALFGSKVPEASLGSASVESNTISPLFLRTRTPTSLEVVAACIAAASVSSSKTPDCSNAVAILLDVVSAREFMFSDVYIWKYWFQTIEITPIAISTVKAEMNTNPMITCEM